MSDEKLRPMIGMFHDSAQDTILIGNIAAGSERSGFSGPGVSCKSNWSLPNEALSCLAGFWFDGYTITKNSFDCTSVSNFIFWKIYMYGIYGEITAGTTVKLDSISIADAKVGVHIIMFGASSLDHVRVDKVVIISNSLIIGNSNNKNGCVEKSPSLQTCQFSFAWCGHLNSQVMFQHIIQWWNVAKLLTAANI
jgi:hypothetical protein